MELYTLNINVNKQRLSFGENKPEIFSGDQSIDFVEFTFEDDMWNFPDIWAIFSRFKGTSYQVALDDNKVMIPAEVMQNRGYVYIGLMATDGENVQTSSVLQYSIGQGSTNVDAITPSASIYEQFLADLDAYQTAVADLDDIESRITTAEGNVSMIEQAVTDLNEQLDDINVDISTINGQITTIQNNIGTAQGDIVSIQNGINTLNGQVAGLDTAVGTLSNRVTALQSSVTSLEGRLTTVGNTLTDFEGRLTTAGTTLTNLEGSISDAENDIQTVQGDIETIQSDIEDIQTAIEQNNVVTDVTAEGISLVDNHIADLSFMCVTDTASGDVASFPDGSGVAMKKAEVSLEPIQDLSHGDPSSTNICPIDGYEDVGVSVRGVNMWDEEWEVGGINSSTGSTDSANDRIRSKNYIAVLPSTSYFAQIVGMTTVDFRPYFYDSTKNFISAGSWQTPTSFTTPSNARYMKFVRYGITTYNNDISINYPSTDHDYHAYAGTDYTTDLGRTVYGGTVDLASGRLVVDRVMFTLTGNESWNLLSSTTNTIIWDTHTQMLSSFINQDKVLSSHYKVETSGGGWANLQDGRFMIAGSTYIGLYSTSANELKAFLASQYSNNTPVQIIGALATPQTYQLTPQQIQTLIGTNNVWSEDGAIEVEYIANLKDYIDKKINA